MICGTIFQIGHSATAIRGSYWGSAIIMGRRARRPARETLARATVDVGQFGGRTPAPFGRRSIGVSSLGTSHSISQEQCGVASAQSTGAFPISPRPCPPQPRWVLCQLLAHEALHVGS